MTKVQLDLDKKENKFVSIMKAKEGFMSKAQTIKHIIKKYGRIK